MGTPNTIELKLPDKQAVVRSRESARGLLRVWETERQALASLRLRWRQAAWWDRCADRPAHALAYTKFYPSDRYEYPTHWVARAKVGAFSSSHHAHDPAKNQPPATDAVGARWFPDQHRLWRSPADGKHRTQEPQRPIRRVPNAAFLGAAQAKRFRRSAPRVLDSSSASEPRSTGERIWATFRGQGLARTRERGAAAYAETGDASNTTTKTRFMPANDPMARPSPPVGSARNCAAVRACQSTRPRRCRVVVSG